MSSASVRGSIAYRAFDVADMLIESGGFLPKLQIAKGQQASRCLPRGIAVGSRG